MHEVLDKLDKLIKSMKGNDLDVASLIMPEEERLGLTRRNSREDIAMKGKILKYEDIAEKKTYGELLKETREIIERYG